MGLERRAADGGTESRLLVWTDFVCPFSWLAEHQLRRLRLEHGVEVEHRAFELRPPGTPPLPPQDADIEAVWDSDLLPLARELGAELSWPALRPRTRKAHELAAFARERGGEDAAREALFRAVFADGRDIGRIDVLVDVGVALGWDAAEVKVALDLDSYAARIIADEVEAAESGIAGTPSFRTGSETLVGLHSYDTLRELAFSRDDHL